MAVDVAFGAVSILPIEHQVWGTCKRAVIAAFDGGRIAKGLPLAAGSMGVARATRICALVLKSALQPGMASKAPISGRGSNRPRRHVHHRRRPRRL
jgi:hypothetical protein